MSIDKQITENLDGNVLLAKQENSSHSRVIKSISEIFAPDPAVDSGNFPSSILIEGAPGIYR